MNRFAAAYQNHAAVGWSRVDMVLALIDGAVERIDKVEAARARGDTAVVEVLLSRARLIVLGLTSGINRDNTELTTNLLRLYEFVLHSLLEGGADDLKAGRDVLMTLRDGYQAIRPEAVRLERSGELPPADPMRWQATA